MIYDTETSPIWKYRSGKWLTQKVEQRRTCAANLQRAAKAIAALKQDGLLEPRGPRAYEVAECLLDAYARALEDLKSTLDGEALACAKAAVASKPARFLGQAIIN